MLLYPVCIKNGSQNDLKIDDKIDDFLGWFFDGLGVDFGTNLASKIDPKSIKKQSKNLSKKWSDFWSMLARFWLDVGSILDQFRGGQVRGSINYDPFRRDVIQFGRLWGGIEGSIRSISIPGPVGHLRAVAEKGWSGRKLGRTSTRALGHPARSSQPL